MVPTGKRKPGLIARLIFVLILIASGVVIWTAVRSLQSAPAADTQQTLPAAGTDRGS